MPLTLGSTIASLQAIRRLDQNTTALSRVSERLSSGQRINRASDDAAGLALSTSLTTDSKVFAQAIRNINDGISAISIASGALRELSDITLRQQELAEQSANGVYSVKQRRILQKEFDQLTEEYNRVISVTKLNGISLLDVSQRSGSIRIQAGYGTEGGIEVGMGDSIDRLTGTGTFSNPASYAGAGGFPLWVHTADINKDGNIDVLYNESAALSVRLGNGDGTLRAATTYTGSYSDFVIQDIDSDGVLDIIGAGGISNMFVQRGQGDGTFGSAITYTTGTSTARVVTGDFNNDGTLDIAASSFSTSQIYIFSGQGNGTFSNARTISVNGDPDGLAVGDIDNDGRLDLLVGKRTSSNYGKLFGNGDGTFSSEVVVSAPNGTRFVQLADWNRDGSLDLLIGSWGNTYSTYLENNGQGSFSARLSISGDHPVEPNDINGDGFLELGATHTGYGFSTLLGNGNGTFNAVTQTNQATSSIYTAFGDLNNDGALDAITSQYQAGGKIFVALANTRQTAQVAALTILNVTEARATLGVLATRQSSISEELGKIGAAESRLSIAASHLQQQRINTLQAAARITDADVAEESAKLVRTKILSEIGAQILAQANLSTSIVLKLLMGDEN